ncbi:hypothetical protein SVAN01_10350 [Stagonosporopsis vannaccii]|nr:hypothetical protein SVAN01_10350 [Stagonosporopsis vannaccii]
MSRRKKNTETVYGLQHGRLHLDTRIPMWMNMGYWKVSAARHKSLAEACRDLLNLVLAETGISNNEAAHRSRCLIDVGFGCGEQTIHLMSEGPVRPSDRLWWDEEQHRVFFDQYVGMTQDSSQCQYAQGRVEELDKDNIRLFCADASKPHMWSEQLRTAVQRAHASSQETWLLALDTAYHFSPSRWVLIKYMCKTFGASFMAFDLCLSPHATFTQTVSLRVLTTLMGAPWVNFITPQEYRRKLVGAGYADDDIKMVDVSDHVFAPLAQYMENQDRRLKMLGFGLKSFQVARWLFEWWGRTGVVRGIVVIAKHSSISTER